jgi:hypothetical protein
VTVAAGDFDGIAGDEVITGTATGAAHVKAFNAAGQPVAVASFIAIPNYTGGIDVAAGDILLSNRLAEVVVTPLTGNGRGQVFTGTAGTPGASFDAGFPTNTGGLRVATGDTNGDSFDEVLVGAGPGSNAVVNVIVPPLFGVGGGFTAFDGFLGGVYVG